MDTKDRAIHEFAFALRFYTPNGFIMTDQEVIDQWKWGGYAYSMQDYGSIRCTCGHPIKHVYFICLKSDPSVTFSKVGSECIVNLFTKDDEEREKVKKELKIWDGLTKILSFVQENIQKRPGCEAYCPRDLPFEAALDEDVVCVDNGFSRLTVKWLQKNMSKKAGQYLENLANGRIARPKTSKQKYLINFVMMPQLVKILKIVFKEEIC